MQGPAWGPVVSDGRALACAKIAAGIEFEPWFKY